MSQNHNDDLDFLNDLEGMTDKSSPTKPGKKKASFQTEKLEERVLFSATWVDAETGEELSNSTEDDDLFTGSEDRDVAYGRAGDDILDGLEGNDVLNGQDGDDVLSGGEGDDRLVGGAGADELSGGAGNDTIYADSQDTSIDGGEGRDRLIVQDDANFSINQAETSIERVDGGSADDTIDASGMTESVTQIGNAGNDTLIGGAGNDSQNGGDGNDEIYGGDGRDSLTGGYGNDVLDGGAGNDNLNGGAGADQLSGGTGNDTIRVDAEDTLIDGGEGYDRVIVEGGEGISIDLAETSVERVDGGSGNDSVNGSGMTERVIAYGNAGNDNLSGGSANDNLVGGTGDDVVSGGAGNDSIQGNDGADQLFGGSGNDTIYADGADTLVSGGEGNDRVIVVGEDDFSIDQAAAEVERVDGGSGNDTLDASNMTERVTQIGNVGDDILIGGSGSDQQTGGVGNDQISGGDGNDRITGGLGADELFGGSGNDTIYADAQDTVISGGEGSDRVIVQGPDDFSIDQAATGVERVDASSGNDLLDASGMDTRATQYGNSGDDVLTGGSGDDIQYGGQGNDSIFGGDGNDRITGNEGADDLRGEGGNDTIYADELDVVHYSGDFSDYEITDRGNGRITVTDLRDGSPDGTDTVFNGKTLQFADGVATIGESDIEFEAGATAPEPEDYEYSENIVEGTNGNNRLRGTSGTDIISGGDGNDNITGGDGADELRGGEGNDTIYTDGLDTVLDGGDGNDRLIVSGERDVTLDQTATSFEQVSGGHGNDTFDASGMTSNVNQSGGDGNDNLIGGSGNDSQTGGEGDDILDGGSGNDRLTGGTGADELRGGDGNDTIYADSADSVVEGGEGTDRVIVQGGGDFSIDQSEASVERVDAGAGNDTLDASGMSERTTQYGNAGSDTLIGGSGNDVQSGGDGDDNIEGGDGNDTIRGDYGDDSISGGDGNDNISGGIGADELRGGAGDDTIRADAQDTLIDGGEGNDRVIVEGGQDFSIDQNATSVERVDAGSGNDLLDASGMTANVTQVGNAGDDVLVGGDGDDRQYGGDGNDSIVGGDGNDRIYGDRGDDLIDAGAGNDVIYGGDGNDTVKFDGNFTDYKLTHSNGRVIVEDLRDGSPDGRDVIYDVENITFADGVATADSGFEFTHQAMDFDGVAIAENSPAGTLVGEFDMGDQNFEYEIVNENGEVDNSSFNIVGNKIFVAENADIDFESSNGAIEILVRSTAEDGDQYTGTLEVEVTDVNEGPVANNDSQLTQFKFVETFDNGNFDGWEPISLGNDTYDWDINEDGEVSERSNSGRGFLGYDVGENNAEASSATNYQITVDVDANAGNTYNNGVGVVFGYEDNQNYYQVSWNDYSDNYSSSSNHKDFTLFKVVDGVQTELDRIDTANLPSEFELGVSVSENGGIQIEVDGESMLAASDDSPSVKTFGLFTYDNDRGVSYDNVQLEISSPLQTNEDTALTFDSAGLLANDVDEDGDAISIKSVQDAEHGTVTLNDDGSITFEPDANYHGPATFTYTAETPDGLESTATVTIEVVSQNDAVTDINFEGNSVAEDSAEGTVVSVLSAADNDTDDTHSFEIVDEAGNVISDANFEVVENEIRVKAGADLDFENQDSFELKIRATDSSGSEKIETVSIEITNVNEGQVTQGESFDVAEDGQVTGNLLINDVDIDGDELTIESFEQPENGTVSIDANGNFTYQPDANFSGTDSFEYVITDGNGATSTQTANIDVAAVADAANVAVEDASGNEDEPIDLDIMVALADLDGSESITDITISNVPAGAILSAGTDNGDGTWSLTNEELEGLQITTAEDSHEDFQLEISVTTAENYRTVDFSSEIQSHGGNQDRNGAFEVSDDGNELFISENGWKSVPGEFVITENTVVELEFKSTETPELSMIGFDNDSRWNNGPRNSDFFKLYGTQSHNDAAGNAFAVYDGSGEYQTIRIPVGEYMSGEFDRMTFMNDDDAVNAQGVEGNSFFRNVRVFEAGEENTTTVSHTINVEVSSVNDQVTDLQISGTTVSENAAEGTVVGVLSAVDADGNDSHNYEFVDSDGNAVEDSNFEIVDGEVRVKAGADLNFESAESHELNIRVTDSGGSERTESFTIAVQDVNEGQIAQGQSFEVDEDGNVSGNLLANDVDIDGDDLSIESFEQPENGTVVLDSNGDFIYEPNENFSGNDTFEYTITDGSGATSIQSVMIHVESVADAAELSTTDVSGNEDSAIALSISTGLVDVDGSESISEITLSNVPDGAILSAGTDNGDGTWTLAAGDLDSLTVTPAENSFENFELEVAVTTTDGDSTQTVNSSFNVEVASVNDAVTDIDLSKSVVNENAAAGTVVGTLSATDADSKETFSYELVDQDGNVVENNNFEIVDGEVRVKPGADLNFESADSHDLMIRVTDSAGSQRTEQFTVEVQDVNEGQIATSETFAINEDGNVAGNLLANDIDLDGDELSIDSFTQPENGTVTVDANGNFVYQPNENFSGTDSFEYVITDGNGSTSTQTVAIDVAAVADEAELRVTDATGDESEPIDLDIAASLQDIDGSERIESVTIQNVPEGASLNAGADNGDGTWTLTASELEGLQINVDGLGNDDFELTVHVETVDGDTTAVQSATLSVNVQNETLEGTLAQQQLDSQNEVEEQEFDSDEPERFRIPQDNSMFESADDFESAFNQIQQRQEVGEFDNEEIWNQPEFESLNNNELETETDSTELVEPDGLNNISGPFVESLELPSRDNLEMDELVEFDQEELTDLQFAISGLSGLDLDQSGDTASLTAASLLMMVTKREDSRKKLQKLNEQQAAKNKGE